MQTTLDYHPMYNILEYINVLKNIIFSCKKRGKVFKEIDQILKQCFWND